MDNMKPKKFNHKPSKFLTDYIVKKYDKYIGDGLDGKNYKTFLRFESSRFEELLEELKAGNSNYVTYLGDTLKGSDYTPEFVSVMTKVSPYIEEHINWRSEVLGAKVANFMGYPTVYNERIIDQDYHTKTLSVDFAQEECVLTSLGDYTTYHEPYSLSFLMNVVSELPQNPDWNMTDEEFEFFKTELIKMYLFRKFVICDNDFHLMNIPIIKNLDGHIYLGPNMDMEDGFNFTINHADYGDCKYCAIRFPEIWTDFVERYQNLMSDKNYKKLVKQSGIEVVYRSDFYNFFESNYDNFQNFLNKLEKELDIDDRIKR